MTNRIFQGNAMRKIQPTYGIIMLFLMIYLWTTAGASGLYTNPVWDQDFPDPSVLQMPDGTFYAYATNGRLEGKQCHIRILKSQDLLHWTPVGDAIEQLAAFNSQSTRNWAPHIVADKGRFYLYYSTNHNQWGMQNKQGMGIAAAVADNPEGPFVTCKDPLVYGEGFEHIDPMLFIDSVSGNKYLYWGSAHKPLKVRQMDDDLLHFKQGSETKDIWPCSDQQPYERLLEGPWVIEKFGKYYLFASGDNCCGDGAHYAVVVARADHPEGPFIPRARAIGTPDSVVLECNDRWLAPGHNAIVTDTADDDWLVYHAYDLNKQTFDKNGKRKLAGRELLIDKIVWKDQWPEKITPSTTPQPAPQTVGDINLALNTNGTPSPCRKPPLRRSSPSGPNEHSGSVPAN